jgi:4-hydroxybenzoate polyprenyltransferase
MQRNYNLSDSPSIYIPTCNTGAAQGVLGNSKVTHAGIGRRNPQHGAQMHTMKSRFLEIKPALILFYLSGTGFLGIMSVQHYLDLKQDPIICLCFMGLIFSIYTFNRFTDATEDFANDIGKYLFFQNKRIFLVLAMVTLAVTLGTLIYLEKLNWLHISLLLTGFGYSYRVIPWFSGREGMGLIRLKEIVLVKNLLVSFWWPASLLAIPILHSARKIQPGAGVGLIGCALFIAILNNTLFHDIMDEMGDRVAGIRTLPTLWGSRNSFLLLWILDGCWVAAVAALFLAGRINGGHAAFLAFLTLYPAFYLGLYAAGKASRTVMEFLSESDLIFFSVGLLLLSRV